MNFYQRTDEDGRCTFTNVPEMEKLLLKLCGDCDVPGDTSRDTHLAGVAQAYGQMEKLELPILTTRGQKEYKVQARIPLRLNQDSPLGTEQNP